MKFARRSALSLAVLHSLALAPTLVHAETAPVTPIKHLIVVVGENVTFDALFATYVPRRGQSVLNLLSQGIVRADGTPGPNYSKAVQWQASNAGSTYTLNPTRTTAYDKLPTPSLIGAYDPVTLQESGPVPDTRFSALTANGPFQITKYAPYASAIGDPVHRFFQMWQQTGGSNEHLDLYTWVASSVGQGGATDGVSLANTGQGGEQMGFFNMSQGDAPLFKQLASSFAISDNYHQAVMGGTGANFFALATGGRAAIYNQNGVFATPPANQIENPDPQAGTADFFTNDGYSGGSYVNCADVNQPGVAAITAFLVAKGRTPNCEAGAYYLVNNYNPPFSVDGTPNPLGATTYTYPPQTQPTIGEALSAHDVSWKWYTGGRDVADVTGDAFYPLVYAQVFAAVKAQFPAGTPDAIIAQYATPVAIQKTRPLLYNTIGDPHNASANVVNGPLRANLKGLATLYGDISAGTLPAVSFVVPKNIDSGHPGYSVPGKYELFLADLVGKVQANPAVWADTAIVITTDEGGGYFDSGYIQNLDFFGDGPRIPLIVVSPYAKTGYVDHTYQDHVSVLKFIERNWGLPPLTALTRDNLPNPQANPNSPYRPANEPAIGDLMNLFRF